MIGKTRTVSSATGSRKFVRSGVVRRQRNHPQVERRRPSDKSSSPSQALGVVVKPGSTKQAGSAARPGLALLVCFGLVFLTVAGVAEVRTRSEILQRGAMLGELSAEHSRLKDKKRRLEAERAFLRHPDQVYRVAVKQFGMLPTTSDRVRQIQLSASANSKKASFMSDPFVRLLTSYKSITQKKSTHNKKVVQEDAP